ncbi:hypothetical protein OD91_2530 [Lutibacter sp. Hel_I_33_5]|uniref:GNAT family N-acetyltransferase n=1 Tax=Lutibacter sp. Hel_I_33_5 TaxID=1566289 RepID=UPI0011A722A0|nr:GNAT family N-acetyltransferase [Lutibacter sp. Hel_I_33_5]TVZ57214.1 hypothetical protein OD91_2530 [Lutibacter sp. Hel_I_33_5]
MNINIKPIPAKDILSIIPLLRKINSKTPDSILEKRLLEMVKLPHYECIGLYLDEELIGISGLWYSTRHYIGKSVEPDHVVIDENHRNKGLGNTFFKWIYEHTKSKGCEGIELNTFVENRKSHKFYYNEGFEIFGFHMLKVLREDQKFY